MCDESLSGVTQCVAHFGASATLAALAAFYFTLAQRFGGATASAMRRQRGVFEIESIVQFGSALIATCYSVYSEFPYSATSNARYHLAAALAVCTTSAAALCAIRRQRPLLSRFVVHGVPTLCTAISCCVTFALHTDVSPYRSYLNSTFAATLLFVGFARVALLFRSVSMLLLILAVMFAGMQRGFQLLFVKFYRVNLFVAFLVIAATSVLLYAYMHFLTKNFNRRSAPRAAGRIDNDVRALDDVDVDDIVGFSSSVLLSKQVDDLVREC